MQLSPSVHHLPHSHLSLCTRKTSMEKGSNYHQRHQSTKQARPILTKTFVIWALCLLILVPLIRFSLIPLPTPQLSQLSHIFPPLKNTPSSQVNESSIEEKEGQSSNLGNGSSLQPPCNYFDGEWVPDARGPIYNGTSCTTIMDRQNCMVHGRPDTGYLFWRWQPKQCRLPDFDPWAFLELIKNKHVSFVGDSLARNQLESLLCLLATASTPELVYREGEGDRNRRWVFRSHNATASVLWSPFLVKGVMNSRAKGLDHNVLHLESADDLWASQLENMDLVVFTVGHWFLNSAVYYEHGSVIGCHYCPRLNHTEIGYFGVLRQVVRTALSEVSRRWRQSTSPKFLLVATFSPPHFDGDWDKGGGCPRKKPHKEGERELKYYEAEIRNAQLEEVAAAAELETRRTARFEVLDVTKLAMMRPDGHPGPYMHADPFAGGGIQERIQNDCTHWCLPGPIDAWNQIFLEVLRRRWK